MTTIDKILQNPIAHRGLHDREIGVIENSKTAFSLAIEAGYGIECDLQLSGDGVPMVFHDPKLDRLTKQTGLISALSAGQLSRIKLTDSKSGDTPQTFEEVLVQVNGQVPLIVEIKVQDKTRDPKLTNAAVEVAKNYSGPIVFKSFYPTILAHLHKAKFPGPIGIIITEITHDSEHFSELTPWERTIVHNLLHYPFSQFDFISSDHKALKLPAIRLLRKIGFPVMTWTVSSAQIEQSARPHADQIVFEKFLPVQ